MIGTSLSHYRITEKLGQGGMGEVYRAEDTNLSRQVAIKVLPDGFAHDAERLARFEREAKLLASLNHPNIAAIYGLEEQEGNRFLVLELVEGQTLTERLKQRRIPLNETLDICGQIAEGLGTAHEKGIIHRDLKPANIKITPEGKVKLLDFGLAKAFHGETSPLDVSDSPTLTESMTHAGVVLGTAAYMSPEQAEGRPLDPRSDIFSLGVVMYEMLCGARPFSGDTTLATLAAILRDTPKTPRKLSHELPERVERLVLRCLEKKPEARYTSARELYRELAACREKSGLAIFRRPWAVAATLLIVLGAAALGVRSYVRSSRLRWVENEALPQVARLMERRRPVAILKLFRQAEKYAPASPRLVQLRAQLFSAPVSIKTTPPAAGIYVRDYADGDDRDLPRWEFLGRTPLQMDRLPSGLYRLRAVREGSVETELAVPVEAGSNLEFPLPPSREAPEGMVFVPGVERMRSTGSVFPVALSSGKLPDFWLDKYEVTNRQYKEFVDRGGYQKPEYWKKAFIKGGKVLSWEQAMAEFQDTTGRPGPATWAVGTYPDGKADYPAAGVSWYEASAYAAFAGKSLPTAYHWYVAARVSEFSAILGLSNFAGQGPAPVGAYQGLGPYGTYDMAGNVKEWSSSPAGDRFYILGGGWNERSYLFGLPDARYPFDRAANFGIRCAKYISHLPEALTGPVPFVSRDRRADKPADDRSFQMYKSLHSYDKTELKPLEGPIDQSAEYWRSQQVTFQAAYGNERVLAHLYLPKNAAPPFQVVTLFPGADALTAQNPKAMGTGFFEFIVRSGRALILPAYKGTLERGPGEYYHQLGQPDRWREMNLQWSKDLGRSIDYLETRPDINVTKLAYYGVSMGAAMAPRLLAVESRFKTAILVLGGSFERVMPEADSWNFAPRVKIPVLMLNGRDDFRFPLETSQRPLFRLLGTADKDKRLMLYDGGHEIAANQPELIKETLAWLDRYLGPVK